MQNRAGSTGTQPGSEKREPAAFTRGTRGEKAHCEGLRHTLRRGYQHTCYDYNTTDWEQQQEKRWGTAYEQPATGNNKLTRNDEPLMSLLKEEFTQKLKLILMSFQWLELSSFIKLINYLLIRIQGYIHGKNLIKLVCFFYCYIRIKYFIH